MTSRANIVTVFVNPAIILNIDHTVRAQGPTATGGSQGYHLALLKPRDLFVDASGSSKALHRRNLVSPASVLVEVTPQETSMDLESQLIASLEGKVTFVRSGS
jgi:hypothetical protein